MEVVLYCVSERRLFLLGIVLFFIMFISGIFALGDEINQTENGLSTGAVDISISEYNQNDEPFLEDGKVVMPGDEISLVPRVNNLGIDCYLRARITYTINNDILDETDYVFGDYSSWKKEGDYYYYESIFGREESLDLFYKVKIPDVVPNSYQGKDVVVRIIVDAVQAKNFDGKWTQVNIKKSVNRMYDIDYEGESSVIYEANTFNHIVLDDSYFRSLGNFLPGDSMSENIRILNNEKTRNEYFLAVDYDDELNKNEIQLLRKMRLVIKNSEGDILTDSNLADKEKHSLGVYQGKKEEDLVVTLSLDEDIDNDYSKIFAKILWKFSYDDLDRKEESPPTGDFQFDMSITAFIISSLGLLLVMVLGKINTGNIEKEK